MSNKAKRKVDRIAAAVLVLLLVVQLMPMNTFAELTKDESVQSQSEEETVTITGTVIAGAEVTLTDAEGHQVGTSVTADENGIYRFSGLTKGDVYRISVKCEDYYTITDLLVSFNNVDESGYYVNDVVMLPSSNDAVYFPYEKLIVKYGESVRLAAENPGTGVTYSTSEDGIASIDTDGNITPVGIGEVTVTATRTDDNATATYTLTIEKGVQAPLKWSNTTIPTALTWNDIYTNTVTGGSSNGAVTYEVTEGSDVAEVNASTGKLTFKKSGIATVTATMSGTNQDGKTLYDDVSAEYSITVGVMDVGDFKFASENKSVTFGSDDNKYQLTASSATMESVLTDKGIMDATGTVKYEIIDATNQDGEDDDTVADIDADTGEVTVKKTGSIKVKASRTADQYFACEEACYTLNIIKGEQGFTYENGPTIDVAVGEVFQIKTQNAQGVPLTYVSLDEDTAKVDDDGLVTAYKAGNVIIEVTSPETDNYESKTLQYTFNISEADQIVTFNPNVETTITYEEDLVYINNATTNTGETTKISYTSSNTDIAEYDEILKAFRIKKAGNVTITATAEEIAGQYKETKVSFELTVNPGTRDVVFMDSQGNEITSGTIALNDENNNTYVIVVKDKCTGDFPDRFEIESGEDYVASAVYNKDTDGTYTITVNCTGKITVKPIYDETDCYSSVNDKQFTLKVTKALSEIRFSEEEYNVYTGESFTAPTAEIVIGQADLNDIRYQLVSDPNGIISYVDPSTGEVTLAEGMSTGEAVIKATKSENDSYESAEATYKIIVTEWQVPGNAYELIGTTVNNSGWYTEEVSVKSADEYDISLDLMDWKASLDNVMTEESDSNSLTFYVRDNTAGYMGCVTVDNVKIDKTAPDAIIKVNEQSTWDKLLWILSFNTIGDNKTTVTLEASDETSGVAKSEYYIEYFKNESEVKVLGADEILAVTDWKTYTESVELKDDDIIVVYARVIDVAGNVTYTSTKGVVVDTSKPVVETTVLTTGVGNYYTDDVKIKVDVNDGIASSGIKEIKYKIEHKESPTDTVYTSLIDGEGILYTFTPADSDNVKYDELVSVWDSEIEDKYIVVDADKYNGDGVKITVIAEDNAGNIKEITKVVNVVAVEPTIDVVFDATQVAADQYDGVDCYDDKRTAKVTITGRYSAFTNPIVTITALDSDGNKVTNAYSVGAWDKQVGNSWDNATQTTTITFNGSAIYDMTVQYTDKAGNEAVSYTMSDRFIVDVDTPTVLLTPDKTDKTHNGVGLYTKNVNVAIKVTDKVLYSGIDTIEYWVTADGKETQREVLYDYATANSGIKYEYTTSVVIDSKLNNTCDVKVYVAVKDRLGNEYTTSSDDILKLDIDATAPAVKITYDNNNVKQTLSGVGYFNATRTATVVITERTAHTSLDSVKNSFIITGKNGKGESVISNYKSLITGWDTVEDTEDVNAAKHTFKIAYTTDANYVLTVNYSDLASNVALIDTSAAKSPYKFTVDTVKPTGSVKVGKLGTWDKLLSTLTFDLWTNGTLDVTATSSDATSAVSAYYIKTDSNKVMTATELDKLTTWKEFSKFTVKSDEQFIIYLKLIDRAGNTTYISSNGAVIDRTSPTIEAIEPAVIVTPQQPVNGIYNGNVTVAVTVEDTIKNGSYSGIKEIRYEVLNQGKVTQDGVLFSAGTGRTQKWTKANAIVVDKTLNNSNDVNVKVYVVDNVGNEVSKSTSIKIDTTAPDIDVRYDNNAGDTSFAESTYFNTNRVATITITERNFDADDVVITVNNTDGVQPILSAWTEHKSNNGNGDATTHTATLTYSADGDYTFAISYADKAGNKSTAVDYGTSLAPTEFTIDKTVPEVQVAYDNNEAYNGNYYATDRVATVTLTEHNFEQSRIVLTMTATDDGVASSLPAIGEWHSNGDVHTLTITYTNDSLYTFDIDYIDKAGNVMADVAQQSFYVDKTMPLLSIADITDESANNADGNIGFVLTATDINFDVFEPVLTAYVKNADSSVESVIYTLEGIATVSNINNGKRYTVENLEADGIYRLTCTLVDKAGNAYTEVLLEREDGSTYTEQRAGEDTLISFSVNRYGSSYALDEVTTTLVENYYVQNVEGDVIITEVNADPLSEYSITLNGTALTKDINYTVTEEHQDGKWYSYTYVIDASQFETDGEYTIVVSSKDKATNNSFSDVKDTSITFVVDRTAPVVSVTGLANDENYQTDSQTVTLVPSDDGGALKSIVVTLVDDDGNEIKKLIELADEELEKALKDGDGKLTFELGEGLNQNVKIECADCSVDSDGNTNVYTQTIKGVSVSTNQFMILWSNKPLRYGVIGGVSAIATGSIAFVLRKRAKKKLK